MRTLRKSASLIQFIYARIGSRGFLQKPMDRHTASSSSSAFRHENLLHSYLHEVRKKSPAKQWKKPVGTQPSDSAVLSKVYKVDPIDFRELVQRLTGAPQLIVSQADSVLQDPPPSTKPLLTRRNMAVPSLMTCNVPEKSAAKTVCHDSSAISEVPSELRITENGAPPRFQDSTNLQAPSYSRHPFSDLLSPNLFSSLEPMDRSSFAISL